MSEEETVAKAKFFGGWQCQQKKKKQKEITLPDNNHRNIVLRPNEVSTYLFDDVTPVY